MGAGSKGRSSSQAKHRWERGAADGFQAEADLAGARSFTSPCSRCPL